MPNAPYDFAAIEKKWRQIWEEAVHRAVTEIQFCHLKNSPYRRKDCCTYFYF